MIKVIFYSLVGILLLSWGLFQFDFVIEAFNNLLNVINVDVISAFGQVYLSFVSYNYLFLLLAIIVIFWIIDKFISWIQGE